jgi:hypothetical protein
VRRAEQDGQCFGSYYDQSLGSVIATENLLEQNIKCRDGASHVVENLQVAVVKDGHNKYDIIKKLARHLDPLPPGTGL